MLALTQTQWVTTSPSAMDLLTCYDSDSDDDVGQSSSAQASHVSSFFSSAPSTHPPPSSSSLPSSSLVSIDPSPRVLLSSSSTHLISSTARTLYHNPTAAELYQPVVGPSDPFSSARPLGSAEPNHVLGYVEAAAVSDGLFDRQYHTFVAQGHTVDPGHSTLHDARVVYDARPRPSRAPPSSSPSSSSSSSPPPKRRLLSDPSAVDDFLGPWKPREAPAEPVAPTEEQLRLREENAARKVKHTRDEAGHVVTPETSTLHAREAVDYQGRSFVTAPPDAHRVDWSTPSAGQCYAPKRLVHTWSGHRRGVSAIRFFPFSAHLLLSASMDTTVKIWNVGGDYRCLRTYSGHAEAVRDASFAHDGLRFLSTSYDSYVKLWDTETGQCISRHTTGKVPFCGRMHPLPVHGHECLVGQANKVVVQWDLRANVVAAEYNEHLATVNSVTFIDDARRFVSTSDDKKVFVWEYGLPVVIKHIADPSMHSIPCVTTHPSGRYFLGQSMDNQVLIFTAGGKYKLKRDKRFVGHQVAGYACEIGVSGDGRWVSSGDGEGRMWVWDWKTGRVVRRIKCHDQVMIGCVWNENETSKVATCSWDGTIKYWD